MNKRALSLDTLVFLVLVAAHFWLAQVAALIPDNPYSDTFLIVGLWRWGTVPLVAAFFVVALGAYVAADLRGGALAERVKTIVGWSVVAFLVLALSLTAIFFRQTLAPHLYVHDGQIQIEYAVRFLLAGKNPYVETYLATPMAQWPFHEPNLAVNPALYHLAYLPFYFLFVAPVEWLALAWLGWFDLRVVLIPLFFITLFLLLLAVRAPDQRRALVYLVALNPLFLPFFVEGRSDAFILFWLVLSMFLLQRNHRRASLLAFVAACASKQTAWFMAPFYLVYFLQPALASPRATLASFAQKIRNSGRLFALAGAFFLLIVAPFVVWDPSAFVEDVFRYPAGLSDQPYPIHSLGFGGIALALGWMPNNLARFPFEWLQLLFGLPTLFLFLRFQLRENSVARLWLSYALFFLVIAFFSNVFNDNHLGYFITLVALGALWEERQ